MQDYVLRNWSIVRGGTSSGQKALFFNLRRLRAKLSRDGRPVDTSRIYATIAQAIGVSQADVATMDARLSGPDISLNAPVAQSDNSSMTEQVEFLVDNHPLPDEAVTEVIDADRRMTWLRDALDVLSERELRIVRERRLSEEGATLEALGTRLGISKERVRQIENRAMEKLRRILIERHPDEVVGVVN